MRKKEREWEKMRENKTKTTKNYSNLRCNLEQKMLIHTLTLIAVLSLWAYHTHLVHLKRKYKTLRRKISAISHTWRDNVQSCWILKWKGGNQKRSGAWNTSNVLGLKIKKALTFLPEDEREELRKQRKKFTKPADGKNIKFWSKRKWRWKECTLSLSLICCVSFHYIISVYDCRLSA